MLKLPIEIIGVIQDANAWTLVYRAGIHLKNASFYKEIIFEYLCQEFYTEGIRAGEVEKVFKESLEKEDYKYLIAFLREHHKV